jgi:hypothetical protein
MSATSPCSRRGSLRIAGATSAVVAAIGLLVGPLIITITDLCPCRSSSCRGFDTGSLLLLCLIVVIGVVEDDYLAITRRPEYVAVEITKNLSAKFLIVEVSTMNEEGSIIGVFLEVLPCSNTSEQGWRDETSDGDPGGDGDPDGAGGGVSASGKGLPFAGGEHSRLMPLLSSIGG